MRLFYGLSLPPHALCAAQEAALRAAAAMPGRYTLPENYHITLAFLGDVPPERLAQAAQVLDRCVRAHPAPEVTIEGLDYFGCEQNAILILRVRADLDRLHAALLRELEANGLPFDRGPFSPHVTLARHARLCPALPPAPGARFTAREAHLYLSARDASGTLRYTPLSSVPFQKFSF